MESFIDKSISAIKEMFGRIANYNSVFKQNLALQSLYKAVPAFDYSRVNYHLTRAIYYASVVEDPTSLGGSQKYGENFLIGATFGKPIINITAGFIMAKLPIIETDKEEVNALIKQWLSDMHSRLYRVVRNWLRDGDAFPNITTDLKITPIAAYQLEVVADPVTGEVQGFDKKQKVEMDGPKDTKVTYVLITEYRKSSPFVSVFKYKDNDLTTKEELTKYRVTGEGSMRLPIVHFANEREDDEQYGQSEYQNLYYLMANYHAIFVAAIENNIFNSKSIPIIKGVENIAKFYEAHGTKNSDGTYTIDWQGQKLLLGGKDFGVSMLQAVQTAADASTLLNLIFWLICQASETPEFIFGTAVASSKASVSEQMPTFINKITRKQNELNEPLMELIKVYLEKAKKLDPTIPAYTKLTINWQPLLDEDGKLLLDVVTFLKENAILSDQTTLELLMSSKIKNPKQEIQDAWEEAQKKDQMMAQGSPNQPQTELGQTPSGGSSQSDSTGGNFDPTAGATPEELAIAQAAAK